MTIVNSGVEKPKTCVGPRALVDYRDEFERHRQTMLREDRASTTIADTGTPFHLVGLNPQPRHAYYSLRTLPCAKLGSESKLKKGGLLGIPRERV
jgi:hypothetical protein